MQAIKKQEMEEAEAEDAKNAASLDDPTKPDQ
jgi:hypothetical protein